MSYPNSVQLSGNANAELDPELPPPAPARLDTAPPAPPLVIVAVLGFAPQPSTPKGNPSTRMEHHFLHNAASPAALLWHAIGAGSYCRTHCWSMQAGSPVNDTARSTFGQLSEPDVLELTAGTEDTTRRSAQAPSPFRAMRRQINARWDRPRLHSDDTIPPSRIRIRS